MLWFIFPLADEAPWNIHIILMLRFEPQDLCYVNIEALRLIVSLWLNNVVLTRYYAWYINVSDYLWPIC
jgi:hypothetical protein